MIRPSSGQGDYLQWQDRVFEGQSVQETCGRAKNLGHTRIDDPHDAIKASRDHKLFYVKKDLAHYL